MVSSVKSWWGLVCLGVCLAGTATSATAPRSGSSAPTTAAAVSSPTPSPASAKTGGPARRLPTVRPVKKVKTDNCSHEATRRGLQDSPRRDFLKRCRNGKSQ